jgi:hypothetical protein
VVGELGGRDRAARLAQREQPLRCGAMGAHAARCAELLVQRLANERVGERVRPGRAGLLAHEPGRERGVEGVKKRLGLWLQRVRREALAEHGGVAQDGVRGVAEALEAPPQHLAHRFGQADLGERAGAGLGEVAGDLDHEEGVPGRLGVHGARQPLGGVRAGARRHQRRGRLGAEAAQAHPLGQPLAPRVGQQGGERVLAAEIARAVGADEPGGRALRDAHQVGEQQERRAVGPVEVVEHNQHRPRRRHAGQQLAHGLEQPEAIALGVARPPGAVQVGERLAVACAGVVEERVQGLGPRLVGPQRLLRAPAHERHPAAVAR